MKKFVYFPSFSAGVYGAGCKMDSKLKNGVSCRFYSKEFPEEFYYPYFLWPAAHFYKRKDLKEVWGFGPEVELFGDSGGYQIASGAIKWTPELKEDILDWLENNSTIAMNLDIPPRLQYNNKFSECLDISRENIKFFHENRKGNTKFLNIIQGNNLLTYKKWYDEVKSFDFEGWAIGGASGSIFRLASGLCALLEGKEHFKDYNKFLHILGTSKIIDFFILAQLQKSFNDVGSKITVTTDSSSPNRSTVYGMVYYGYDLKNGSFKSFHVPKERTDKERNKTVFTEQKLSKNDIHLPLINNFHKWLKDGYEFQDIKDWNNLGYITAVLHNFYLFRSAIDEINYFVNGDPYLLEQVVSKETFQILKSIDELVKADDPKKVFSKYSRIYHTADQQNIETTHNEFF